MIIKTENLTKVYGKKKILDCINLKINEGEIFGILGPNGAGKTTLMSTLSTLLLPTRGRVYIDGLDANKCGDLVRKKLNDLIK